MENKRRIFIESDILHKDELMSVKRTVALLLEKRGDEFDENNIFDEALDFAWHDIEKTWLAVKAADEIYANSSLMPLIGNSYMGAPVIFNGMCERAIKENVTGKSVIILRPLKDMDWEMIDFKLMKKAFKSNELFVLENRVLVKVDVSKIKKG